jgi:hypothetical protein
VTTRGVPGETELFDFAVATRAGCVAILGARAEDAIGLLATAAFQLQAAHVGARMAAMADDGAHTATLRAVASDYGGAFSAALNLSVRCSATAVDLCAATAGRLSGHSTSPTREWDAADMVRMFKKSPPSSQLAPVAGPLLARLNSTDWGNTEHLRHQVTHKRYKRGVYATTRQPPNPAPLAYPQQIDVEWGGGMVPMDVASSSIVDFADATFREFCTNLAALGSP